MKKLSVILVLALAVLPLCAQDTPKGDDYYTGYEGLVLGEKAPRSATDAIAEHATQEVPGDIYRGTVFGAEQKKYDSTTLGDRKRATKKFVYDTSLVRAVKISDVDRVRTLMYANVNVNEKNYAGITPLTIAAEKGNMEIIKMLVEDGKATINEASSYGITPLISAAAAGQDEAVAYLIQKGADVTVKDDLGKTALLYAIGYDKPKLINNLISLNNAAVNLPDNAGNTPLIYATQKGLFNNVKLLVSNGANVDYRNPATGLSALAAAAAEGHSNIIRYLVKIGKADVNLTDLSGRTPVFYAVEHNKTDALRTLLSLGANVNAKDNTGTTPLMRATSKNQQDCIEILLREKKTVNPNEKDSQGRSALTYAVYSEDLTPAQQLLAANADLNVADNNGNTPLMNAIKAKNDRAALLFIQNGADLTLLNAEGKNAFALAEEFLPQSSTINVLNVKKKTIEEQAMQVQAQKLAEVRALEEELASQEALVKQLQDEQKAKEEAAAKAAKEAEEAAKRAEEEAVRAEVEAQFQEQAAALESDPELVRLQQQLEAARAQKQAALQEAMDRQVAEKLGKVSPEPSVLKEEAAKQVEEVKQTADAAKAKTQQKVNKAKTTAKKRRTTARKKTTAAKAKVEQTVEKATVAPQEINMADLLAQ